MNHKLAFLVCLATLPTLAAEGQAPTAPPPVRFHSEALHLDYTFPASFVQRDTSKDATHPCGNQAISAVEKGSAFRMIILQDEDGGCLNKNLANNLVGRVTLMANSALQRLGTPTVSNVTMYEMGKHRAFTADGSVIDSKGGKTRYVAVTCQMIGQHAACWELLATSCSALTEMESYSVTFADEPRQRLIPESLKPACK